MKKKVRVKDLVDVSIQETLGVVLCAVNSFKIVESESIYEQKQ